MPQRRLARALTIGAVSGLAATLVMDQFFKLASSSKRAIEKQEKLAEGESPWTIAHEQVEEQQESEQQEDSTEVLARKVSEAAGHHLSPEQKKIAGRAVHFSFGTLMGIVYSTAAEYYPETKLAGGLAYGTLLFLTADEIAVPAFRLSPPPTQTTAANHLQHWVGHLVYGGTLELCRKALRRM
jgi:putative membrane protein